MVSIATKSDVSFKILYTGIKYQHNFVLITYMYDVKLNAYVNKIIRTARNLQGKDGEF